MGKWSELPRDLLNSVADRLTVAIDRAVFNGVCRNWSSVAHSKTNYLPCNPPWLILVENSGCSRRGFVGVSELSSGKESFDLDLPEAQGTRCLSSTGCWVVMVDADCNMFILNPFSRSKIDLPPLREFKDYMKYISRNPSIMTNLFLRDRFLTGRVALSFPLNKSPAEAFVAVAIFDGNHRLAYTRKGSKSWINVDTTQSCFFDVAFYQGKFYAVDGHGTVFEFSISFKPHGKPQLECISETLTIRTVKRYLVEVGGMLLQVIRHISYIDELVTKPDDYCDYQTDLVHVFELDFLTGGWVEVNDLGEHSIFAGFNTCVSLLASSTSTFKPNCIYFTDDNRLGYLGESPSQGGRDMVVFNLADRSIQPHYTGRYSLSSFSPPIWVIPTSMYHSKR